MNELKQIVNDAFVTLKGKVQDLSTISVTTLTGDVNQIFDPNTKVINLAQALTKIEGNLQGKLELIAHTEIKLDNDAMMYVKKDFTANDEMIFKLHQSMLTTALQARNSFFEFCLKAFGV